MPANPQDEAGRGWQVKPSIAAPKKGHGRHRPCGLSPKEEPQSARNPRQRPRACPDAALGLFFDITLGLLAVTEGPNYFCRARKCCTISQPWRARHLHA